MNYQRDVIGDKELEVSPWAIDASRSKRSIDYRHPIRAPVGPPSARATKEQTLQRFDGCGLCLDTRTIVVGVPIADCFHVDDRILVEATPEGGVTVRAMFQVRFVKNTMLKNIVRSTTNSEFKEFFAKYQSFLTKAAPKKDSAMPFGLFLCGMEESCVNPMKGLEERLGNRLASLEKGVTYWEERLEHTFADFTDGACQANTGAPVGSHVGKSPLPTKSVISATAPMPSTGVELVYLSGLASELSSRSQADASSKNLVIQSAMRECSGGTESEWESLFEGVYAQWRQLDQRQKDELLGYSVFEDNAVVVTLLDDNYESNSGVGAIESSSLSIEVVAC